MSRLLEWFGRPLPQTPEQRRAEWEHVLPYVFGGM